LSRWYIRQSRQRFVDGDLEALQTLWQVIINFCKTTAPLIPFITEYLWQRLMVDISTNNKNNSIHLQDYLTNQKVDDELLNQMQLAQQICEQGNMIRKTNNISTRQPLNKVIIDLNQIQKLSEQLCQIIKNELNVKKIEFNLKKPTLKVSLDTVITKDLAQEGELRNLIRQIQNTRKNMGMKLTDKIKIFAPNWPKEFEKDLLSKTNAISISKSNQLKIEKI